MNSFYTLMELAAVRRDELLAEAFGARRARTTRTGRSGTAGARQARNSRRSRAASFDD